MTDLATDEAGTIVGPGIVIEQDGHYIVRYGCYPKNDSRTRAYTRTRVGPLIEFYISFLLVIQVILEKMKLDKLYQYTRIQIADAGEWFS